MSPVPAPDPVSEPSGPDVTPYLGKLIPVGFGGAPTFVDQAATDWADVVANNLGWVQFIYGLSGDVVDVYVGRGAGASYLNIAIGPTGTVFFDAVGPTGETAFSSGGLVVNNVFNVDPDGKVGGVTPNDGDQLTWDAGSGSIKWKGPLV